MKIISALYDNKIKPYREMAVNMTRCLEKLGYHNYEVRSLSNNPNIEEDPNNGYYMPVFMEKLPGIRLLMNQTGDDVFWIDVDCLVRERFNEIAQDCDMCFTVRRPTKHKNMFDGYLNGGVFFLKNCQAVKSFLEHWIEVNKKAKYGDQQSLTEILLKFDDLQSPKTFDVMGCKTKTVSCDTYNHFYFDGSEKAAKILHFKGQFDRRLYQYWVDKTLGEPNAV